MILYLYCFEVMVGSRQWLKLFCSFIDTKYEVSSNLVEQRPVYVCMYECIYVCMYVCMYVFMYIYKSIQGPGSFLWNTKIH